MHETKTLTKATVRNGQSYAEWRLEWIKEDRGWFNLTPEAIQEEVKRLRKVYHEIPKVVDFVNAERKIARDNGLERLDGRVVPALEARDLMKYVGARKLTTDFTVGYTDNRCLKDFDIHVWEAWWCHGWFAEFLRKVSGPKRRKMYDKLEELRGDPDALESELGLMILHSME